MNTLIFYNVTLSYLFLKNDRFCFLIKDEGICFIHSKVIQLVKFNHVNCHDYQNKTTIPQNSFITEKGVSNGLDFI